MTTDYLRAVTAAYKERARYDVRSLWFDPFLPATFVKELRVCKYSTFCSMYGFSHSELVAEYCSEDGFTLRDGSEYIIVYNDDPSIGESRRRFTMAHEIGHFVLRHRKKNDAEEREADCFARNLLAPRLLAKACHIPYEAYPAVFQISRAAARVCSQMADIDEDLATRAILANDDLLRYIQRLAQWT